MTNNTPDYEDNLYFDTQNTKKDLTSEQLTEQWKKGKLPSGEYYIIDDLGLHTTDKYYPSHGFGTELPQSVLGRVPSYEQWQAKLEENAQLKELLEECRHIIGIEKDFASCHFEEYTLVELLTKIDEVLK